MRFPCFSYFHEFVMCILIYFGIIQEPPRISLQTVAVSRDNFGGILRWSDFSRNPTIMKIYVSSLSCDSFLRNSAFQTSITLQINLCLCFLGLNWKGRSGCQNIADIPLACPQYIHVYSLFSRSWRCLRQC